MTNYRAKPRPRCQRCNQQLFSQYSKKEGICSVCRAAIKRARKSNLMALVHATPRQSTRLSKHLNKLSYNLLTMRTIPSRRRMKPPKADATRARAKDGETAAWLDDLNLWELKAGRHGWDGPRSSPTGLTPGARLGRCAMSTWEAQGRWMRRPPVTDVNGGVKLSNCGGIELTTLLKAFR
jgi:hypothetical protein